MTLESCFVKFPYIKEYPIYIDGSNAAYSRFKNNKKPSLDDITLLINHVIVDLKFDREKIHCSCDPALRYYIDKPIEYEALIKEEVIVEAPKVADEFILSFALKHEFCFIISNDKFREYLDQLPNKQWLDDRKVPFMFLGSKVCLSPNIDFNRIDVLPLNDEVDEIIKSFKEEKTTLEILEKMEQKEGEFDLF